MDDTERVGRRIAAVRKTLDMTQQQLADAAKVSKSMLAKVESGHATASTVWIGAVARVLGVDVAYLTGGPNLAGPDNALVHRFIPDIRRALATWDLLNHPSDLAPAALDDIAGDVEALGQLRRDAAYAKIGAALPGVLARLTVATRQPAADRDRERAYALLAMAYRAANSMAHKLGYLDLSFTALDRMEWAASHSGDPLLPPIVDYLRAGALGRIGEHLPAVGLLNRAIAAVEPAAAKDRTARAVLGCLHMKLISIYGSVTDADMVATHTAEAARIAASTGPDHVVYETVFGPTNVQLHALSARVDMAQPGEALEVAAATRLPNGMAKERATYYWTDLARAHLLNSDPDAAIEALYEARTVAPQHFVNSAVVRGAIYTIASHQRRATRGLRHLANSVGIHD